MKKNQIHQDTRRSAEATARFGKISIATGAVLLGTMAATQASTDYPPAIWRQACSSHWYTSGSAKVLYVEHDMEGYYASTISYLQGCNNTVSIHYCVNGKQDTSSDMPAGEITQMVRDAYYAWHASCLNQHAFGTEHEGFASNPAWYTEALYQTSAACTRFHADNWGFTKDRNHIIGHNEWQNSAWVNWCINNVGFDPRCNTHTDPGPYWDWSHYMALVTGTGSSPGGCGVCSRGSGLMDVFTRRADNHLGKKSYGSGGWSVWENLGETLTSDPAAVSPNPNQTEVYWRGSNGSVYHKTWNSSSGWSATFSIGGAIVGAPAVCSRSGTGTIDVFGRGTDNALWKNSWTGSGWTGWSSLGEVVTGDPAACAKDANTVDVFWRGSDGALWKKTWTTSGGWTASSSIGGAITWGPGATSKDGSSVDVFVRGTDQALYKNTWVPGTGWSGFQHLGGSLASSPDAGSSDSNSVNSFYRGTDGAVYQEYWQSGVGWNLVSLGKDQ